MLVGSGYNSSAHISDAKKISVKRVLGVEVQPVVVAEPVLDVPAIDMTDPVAASKKVRASRWKLKPTGAKRSGANRRPPKVATAGSRRDGSVGRVMFQRVEALVKEGTSKSGAFKLVAAETGKNVGAVSANYYRIARASGAVKPGRAQGKAVPANATRGRKTPAQSATRPRSARSGNNAGNVDQIVGQLVASVRALTEAVQAQDADVRELRGRLNGLRRAMG